MTIKSGSITYPGANSALSHWRPENDVLYEFVLAACTTVFIYQATAVSFDLLLGWRKKGSIRTSDLAIFMAMSDYSLQSTSSIFHQVRKGFRAYPQESAGTHSYNCGILKNQSLTLVKVCFLIIVVPIIRILGVSLSLSHDQIITFKQAKFGGFSLGIGEHPLAFDDGISCKQMVPEFGRGEIERTEFFLCWQGTRENGDMVLKDKYEDENYSMLFLGVTRKGRLEARFVTQYFKMEEIISANIRSNKKVYQVLHSLRAAEGRELIQDGLERMLSSCSPNAVVANVTDSNEKYEWFIEVVVDCKVYSVEEGYHVLSKISRDITFVNSDKAEVVSLLDDGHPDTFPVDDFPLLLRRHSLVSLPILMISTLGVVFMRILLHYVVADDAHIVVEMILKKRLEIPLGHSLLASKKIVSYEEELETVASSFSQTESETNSGRDEEQIEKPD